MSMPSPDARLRCAWRATHRPRARSRRRARARPSRARVARRERTHRTSRRSRRPSARCAHSPAVRCERSASASIVARSTANVRQHLRAAANHGDRAVVDDSFDTRASSAKTNGSAASPVPLRRLLERPPESGRRSCQAAGPRSYAPAARYAVRPCARCERPRHSTRARAETTLRRGPESKPSAVNRSIQPAPAAMMRY